MYDKIKTISSSIGYDPLRKEVWVRSSNLEGNYAILRTIMDVLEKRQSNYKNNLNNMIQEAESNLTSIKEDLKKNYQQYKFEFGLNISWLAGRVHGDGVCQSLSPLRAARDSIDNNHKSKFSL